MINAARLLINNLPGLKKRFSELSRQEVFVGVPRDESTRRGDGPNNAMLAYIHDNGSPARNIPARPFMLPGIEKAKANIVKALEIGARDCLEGDVEAIGTALHKTGLIAQRSIRGVINEGIAPPLADSTLRARIRARRAAKGAKAELDSRAAGEAPSATGAAKPLIVTGQLRNSINYVIKDK